MLWEHTFSDVIAMHIGSSEGGVSQCRETMKNTFLTVQQNNYTSLKLLQKTPTMGKTEEL